MSDKPLQIAVKRICLWVNLIAMYMGAYVCLAPLLDPKGWERPMRRVIRKIIELEHS